MSTQKANPFVMPGMGQAGDMANNPLTASMEMMRQAWESLSGPGGLAQALPINPTVNLSDLERRIAELRSVENWLKMNLSMLSSTIQGMEVQRSTIATLRAFADSMTPPAGMPSFTQTPPSEPAPQPQASPEPETAGRDAGTDVPPMPDLAAGAQAAQSASQAWWNMLQGQFNQLAAATAATLQSQDPGTPAKAGGAADSTGKSAKTASASDSTGKPARKKASAAPQPPSRASSQSPSQPQSSSPSPSSSSSPSSGRGGPASKSSIRKSTS